MYFLSVHFIGHAAPLQRHFRSYFCSMENSVLRFAGERTDALRFCSPLPGCFLDIPACEALRQPIALTDQGGLPRW